MNCFSRDPSESPDDVTEIVINSSNISGREKTKPRALSRVHTSNSDGYELSKDRMPRIRRAKNSDIRKVNSRGGKYKRILNIQDT